MIKKAILSLTIINIFLLGVAIALWQLPHSRVVYGNIQTDTVAAARTTILRDTVIKERNQPVIVSEQNGNADIEPAPKRTADKSRINGDIASMAKDNPFYAEAAKVLSGKLEEKDAGNRRMILNYCEHLRTSYTTKDIDFLRQVFSQEALIIVGNVVRTASDGETAGITGDERVTFSLKTKREYLDRLEKVFAANKKIDVKFSDFHIMRHPTMEGIYGVSLKQKYTSDRYSDNGYLFLLWDFRDRAMPLIHVRTWQPSSAVSGDNDIIGIKDFNFE